jgi:hypothetical protein
MLEYLCFKFSKSHFVPFRDACKNLSDKQYKPSVHSKTTRGLPLQTLLLQCFWRRGDVIPRDTGQTFYAPVPTRFTLVRSQGTYTPDDIRPLADMLHEHLGPRGIPYRFQRGRFVTGDLNPTTASHSTPTSQINTGRNWNNFSDFYKNIWAG